MSEIDQIKSSINKLESAGADKWMMNHFKHEMELAEKALMKYQDKAEAIINKADYLKNLIGISPERRNNI